MPEAPPPPQPAPRESRLDHSLRALLHGVRIASLATLDEDGQPAVSMVPFAIEREEALIVLHISALAAHTGHLERHSRCALLIARPEQAGQPVHALERASFTALASTPEPESARWQRCRSAYLARFPEAQPMTALPDFRFVALEPTAVRHIAGFGAARSVAPEHWQSALRLGPPPAPPAA